MNEKSLKNCGGQLVRNLNGTLKKLTLPEFVDLYKAQDKDYRELPKVCTIYDRRSPNTTLISGSDAEKIEENRQKIKLNIYQSKEKYGDYNAFEAKTAKRNYILEAKRYLKSHSTPLKADNGENLTLEAYFKPQYYTKGAKKGELKGFSYVNAKFLKDTEINQDRKSVV